MRVLITGANGFIGRHLVRFLLEANLPLTLFMRQSDISWVPKGDVRIVKINDFGSNTNWREALKDVSYIINLTGRAHIFKEVKKDPMQAFMSTNCDGAIALYKAASKAGIKGFLQISSIGVLGTKTPNNSTFNDNSIPNPTSPYAISKFEAEKALIKLNKNDNISLIILRPPLIIGANSKGNFERLLKLVNKPIPLPLMGIKNKRTLLCVENLNSAILAVFLRWQNKPISGTYVLADEKPISTSDIIKSIYDGAKGRAFLFSIPSVILSQALKFAGGAKLVEQIIGNLEVDSTRFYSDFNWKPQIDTHICLKKSADMMFITK